MSAVSQLGVVHLLIIMQETHILHITLMGYLAILRYIDPNTNTFIGFNPDPTGLRSEPATPNAIKEIPGDQNTDTNPGNEIDDYLNTQGNSGYLPIFNNCVDQVDSTLQDAGYSGGDIGDTADNPTPFQYFTNLPGKVNWSMGTPSGTSLYSPSHGGPANAYDLIAPH
jgi:hypothetical protein